MISGDAMKRTRTIKVDYLARVEGEGALLVKIKDGAVADVKLKIFEPPRFFEAFLRGRQFTEAPDITARICGICPIAYQMSAVHAMEDACGIRVEGQLRALRRLIYCGEWIESHTLHIYMLHAPESAAGTPSIRAYTPPLQLSEPQHDVGWFMRDDCERQQPTVAKNCGDPAVLAATGPRPSPRPRDKGAGNSSRRATRGSRAAPVLRWRRR